MFFGLPTLEPKPLYNQLMSYITACNKVKVIHWYKIDQVKANLMLLKI